MGEKAAEVKKKEEKKPEETTEKKNTIKPAGAKNAVEQHTEKKKTEKKKRLPASGPQAEGGKTISFAEKKDKKGEKAEKVKPPPAGTGEAVTKEKAAEVKKKEEKK